MGHTIYKNSIHRPTNEANMNGELSNAKKLSPYEDKLNYHSMPDRGEG
jgi:hypothetical protein